jgi:uncharacterized protein YndB with AHSA1/START domain
MTTGKVQPFLISREFDAPRELVWQAWTEAEHMGWWGPKEVTIHNAKMDLQPGGIFHYAMKPADGGTMWGKWVIREVADLERLVFVNSFSDEAGGITRHPMHANWPLEILSTIRFVQRAGKTTVRVEWFPINASEVERATFDKARELMKSGWGGSLDRLGEYLATGVK